MHKFMRKFRTILSIPFVLAAVALMGIATWIIPKPQHLKSKDKA